MKRQDDYSIRPLLWGIAIGGSSSGKTPMLKKGVSFLEKIDEGNGLRLKTIYKNSLTSVQHECGSVAYKDELEGIFLPKYKALLLEMEQCDISVLGGIRPLTLYKIQKSPMALNTLAKFQLAVWPDKSKIDKWVDRAPDMEAERKIEETFFELFQKMQGIRSRTFRFTGSAQNLFNKFLRDHWTQNQIKQ